MCPLPVVRWLAAFPSLAAMRGLARGFGLASALSVCAVALAAPGAQALRQDGTPSPAEEAPGQRAPKTPRPPKLDTWEDLLLAVDGRQRTAGRWISPVAPASGRRPVLVCLHGGGGTGAQFRKSTGAGFERAGRDDGLIVLYPDGIGRQWNDGRADAPSGPAFSGDVDDVAFLRQLVALTLAQCGGDAGRVYATGHSNGGLMCWRLARDASDVFAALAPVCALLPDGLQGDDWKRPLPLLLLLGDSDPLVPFAGGDVGPGWGRARGRVLSFDETLAFTLRQDRLAAEPSRSELLPDGDPADGTRIVRRAYERPAPPPASVPAGAGAGDAAGATSRPAGEAAAGTATAPVEVLLVQGGGHGWPRGSSNLGEKLIGKTTQDADGADLVWPFLRAQRLPGPR